MARIPDRIARTVRSAGRALGREQGTRDGAPNATEPCTGCGEATAIGTVFYSDRHVIACSDGRSAFLCALCDSRIRASRGGKRLTDEQVRNVVENGSAAAYLWSSGAGPL